MLRGRTSRKGRFRLLLRRNTSFQTLTSLTENDIDGEWLGERNNVSTRNHKANVTFDENIDKKKERGRSSSKKTLPFLKRKTQSVEQLLIAKKIVIQLKID